MAVKPLKRPSHGGYATSGRAVSGLQTVVTANYGLVPASNHFGGGVQGRGILYLFLVRRNADDPFVVVHRAKFHGHEEGTGAQRAPKQPALHLDVLPLIVFVQERSLHRSYLVAVAIHHVVVGVPLLQPRESFASFCWTHLAPPC